MFRVNDCYGNLNESYLFSQVAKRVTDYQNTHNNAEIIRLGIGDVTRPLCPAVIQALHKAVDEQSDEKTFYGYGPEQGYVFLREKIAEYDYRSRGIDISIDEIFISDGAKSDTGNIGDILSINNVIALTDPVYPVYIDTNIMSGRAGNKMEGDKYEYVELLPCSIENNFIPDLPKRKADMIYLCYPNNPTGTTLTRKQLEKWVEYAHVNGSLILFDSAYEAFITDIDVPHSIYEIKGAKDVAIEFRSFSKTAGFTGLRCGYTVVPANLSGIDNHGRKISLHKLWNRRQCTKFNGASYLSQRAAEAVYSEEGCRQIKETIDYYLGNASIMLAGLRESGLKVYGGTNAPYIWVNTPGNISSWDFFDMLLDKCHIASTPGVGFGPSGEGYVRLTAFNTREKTLQAVENLKNIKF